MADYKRGKRRIEIEAEVTIKYNYSFEVPEDFVSDDADLLDRTRRYVTGALQAKPYGSLAPLVSGLTVQGLEVARSTPALTDVVLREERWHERRIPAGFEG